MKITLNLPSFALSNAIFPHFFPEYAPGGGDDDVDSWKGAHISLLTHDLRDLSNVCIVSQRRWRHYRDIIWVHTRSALDRGWLPVSIGLRNLISGLGNLYENGFDFGCVADNASWADSRRFLKMEWTGGENNFEVSFFFSSPITFWKSEIEIELFSSLIFRMHHLSRKKRNCWASSTKHHFIHCELMLKKANWSDPIMNAFTILMSRWR